MKHSYIVKQEYFKERNILVLSLNRSKQLNAINRDLLMELRSHLEDIQEHRQLDVLIISSELSKSFSTGIDVGYVRGLSNEEAADFFSDLADTFEMVMKLPCITIAAVSGYAYGAGADLALSCDLRIGSASSRFSFPGPQFGLILGTQRLMKETGSAITRHLVLSGQVIDSNQALQYGLIHEICENTTCFETAIIRANHISLIPNHAQKLVKAICSNDQNSHNKIASPVSLARNSVLEGDFQERFSHYIERVKIRKKKAEE
ncbi:enoyl-CoA hydratase/isomerase family protein [Bacillus sp. JJ1773]|uniref:enoyl-CoA hydratase/isomerase family protein n=1 Tax=Bacillus sp. JJ1773 TaxID=3122965 RepID=UPI002FFEB8A0